MASPPSADFSFTAPFPALKQRRVSLALPASAPRVPWSFRDDTGIAGPSSAQQQPPSPTKEPKKGKIRKTEPLDPAAPVPEKKPRKKWSPEETQMLVEGCNRHGVGNWKTILSDPTLKFDNRSPVDLKDRFRTYFPDAYKKHYPNARTHLSSKVRSTLPDGSSLFEKTRSKRRRPFTEEEDRALKAGYEKHGTVWATIVKDPIFQEQNRRSTDLRDRFRNAFPELYQAAGYKPRNNTSKKRRDTLVEEMKMPGRAATDDQLALSSSGTTGPVRGVRRRRAQTSQGILLRGGTKSVPQSTAPSEDEDSSAEDEGEMSSTMPRTPLLVGTSSTEAATKKNGGELESHLLSPASTIDSSFPGVIDDDDMGMRLISLDPLPDPLADYPTLDGQNPASAGSGRSGIDTPTHGHHAWSSSPQSGSKNANDSGGADGGNGTNTNGSPTTSNNTTSHVHSAQGGLKIGQSAWGPQDWLSANPRLDHSFTPNANANGSSTPGTGTPSSYFSPSSPFTSFNLTPLNPTHPLSPPSNTTNPTNANSSSTSTNNNNNSSLIGNLSTLSTLNLPMNNYNNYYGSHQHHGVIERYDLWPPSSSALSLSSSFSAMNNSSAWSSALTGSGGVSGHGSLSAFSSSFGGDISSEVSFEDTHSAFSDDAGGGGGVFGDDGTYSSPAMGYVGATGSANTNNNNNTGWGANRAIHSDYAGDLIFGARGYGIGGGFGWFGSPYAPGGGVGAGAVAAGGSGNGPSNNAPNAINDTTGLGLVGVPKANSEKIGRLRESSEGGTDSSGGGGEVESEVVGDGKGSINPMQLHTSSGVDEIALAGISLNDVDVDEDMDEDMDEAMEDDAMDGTTTSSPGSGSEAAASVGQEKQQSRGRDGRRTKSNASPEHGRRLSRVTPLSPIHSHTHQHAHQYPHTPTHAHHNQHHHHHSQSLGGMTRSTTPGPTTSSNAGGNMYGGRFSLDDLDLADLAQQQNLVDMNNLTPPATPMMHAVTQGKGMRRYSVYGVGLGGAGANPSGGVFLQNQQPQGGRSTSVPPSEVRNPGPGNPVGLSFGGGGGSVSATRNEVAERGRSTAIPGQGGAQSTPGVKRSLSSTVHHSHGHGHSLSMSTLPPLPPHSEIWRSSTPVAKTTPTPSGSTAASAATGTTASIFNSLFSTPPHSSSSTPSTGLQGFNGMNSTNNLPINAEYTNPDLPFLDLHYNFGHQQQQGFGAMMVDAPSATATSNTSMAATAVNIGMGMTQAEVEARQALDLAHPFYLHGHGHHTHHNAHGSHDHPHGHHPGQGFSFGTNNGNNNNSNAGAAGGAGLKALVGSMFNTPLSVTRQLSQFSASRQNPQAQGHGHQRVQSQQVVNPKDLVLNASPVGSGSEALRLDNKRKRASWDGGLV